MEAHPGSRSPGPPLLPQLPPLPRYPAFKIREGTFHASVDFVQALADISSGLVDVFPLFDRQKALKEVGGLGVGTMPLWA